MKRVVLVFLKHPTPGRVKTRLAADLGDEAAAAAYGRLVCRGFEQVRRANPDAIAVAYDPPECLDAIREWLDPWLRAFPGDVRWLAQAGGNLGERLEAAVGSVLGDAGGDAGVVAVGTDCVHLDPPLFEEAWRHLETGVDAVFGPSEDGGYYLVALREPQPALFGDIPWSTERTLEASLAAGRAAGLALHQLPPRRDVDTLEDWRRVESEVANRRAVFFDRDGVVNRSPGAGYVRTPDEFALEPGIVDALRWVKERDALAILATSQKGVGKGLMTQDDLDSIHRHMQAELARSGVAFDGIYAHTGVPGDPHPLKPDPGMLLAAARDFYVDLSRSWLIGDADRDIAMGRAAGLAGTVRVSGDKPVGTPADANVATTMKIAKTLSELSGF